MSFLQIGKGWVPCKSYPLLNNILEKLVQALVKYISEVSIETILFSCNVKSHVTPSNGHHFGVQLNFILWPNIQAQHLQMV